MHKRHSTPKFIADYTRKTIVLEPDFDELAELDYLDIDGWFDVQTKAIEDYAWALSSENSTYQSATTGETFYSIAEKAKNYREVQLERYNSYILTYGIAKNKPQYIAKLNYDNKITSIDYLKNVSTHEINLEAIDLYERDMATVVLVPSEDTDGKYYMSRTKIGVDYFADEAETSMKTAAQQQLQVETNNYTIQQMQAVNATAEQTAQADKMVEIVNFLNDKGVRNMLGGKMTHSSVNTMLKNRRYIGELSFRDIVVPDAIPVIVPKDLFDRVQKRLDKNKRAPACGKADEEYLLTTKLFCGKCGALMFGESGTSATGRTYYYYKCANVKRRKGCNKKTVQKDWLEDLVVRKTMKLIQDDAVIDKIVQLVMDVQNQENTTIPLLEKQLREVNKKLDNLMKAIEDGLYTRTTKERLEALEIQKDELTAKIADEKLKKPSFNEDFIRFWLMKFRKFDISQKKQRKALIEIFVNAIFLYDDRMLITFNYKDGTQTVRFEDTLTTDSEEEKSLGLSSLAGFFCFQSKLVEKIRPPN